MTKQQEVFIDVSKLTLEAKVRSDDGSSKGSEDIQNIKALQAELDNLHTNLESKINIVQETKNALLHSEQEVNVRTTNKNEISGRLAEIRRNIEDRENRINVLRTKINEANDEVNKLEVYKTSLNPEYTEWHYTKWWEGGGRSWLIARFPGHHGKDWLNGYDLRIENDHVDIALGYPSPYFRLIEPNFTKLIFHTNFVHKFYACGVYAVRHIILHHGIDEGYEQYIKEANENLDKEKARKEEIEVQIQRLEQEIKEQEGEKIGVEAELQRIEEALRSVEIEKEKVKVNLQEVLQEQQSLEIRCAELKELISKEELKIAEEMQKSEETVEVICTKLLKAMELVENGNITEENRQLLVEALQDLEDVDQEGEFTAYLEKGDDLLDKHFEAIQDDAANNIQEREVQGNYIYLT